MITALLTITATLALTRALFGHPDLSDGTQLRAAPATLWSPAAPAPHPETP